MAQTLTRKPAKGGRKRKPPARKKPAAAIEITNAQLAAELRGVARRLGISLGALSGLIVVNLKRKGLVEPDDSVSIVEFDKACRARREARLRRREAVDAHRRFQLVGTPVDEIAARGAEEDTVHGGTRIGNPDELVEGAAELLRRRAPENWAAMVAGAVTNLRQAIALELARPIVSRADYQQARQRLKVFRPDDEEEED